MCLQKEVLEEINTGFELILEVIEDKINTIKGLIQNYEKERISLEYLVEEIKKLEYLVEKIKKFQKKCKNLLKVKVLKRKKKRKYFKLKKGLRTPENAFRIPILQSLNELGGSALAKDVLQRVYQKMKEQLNEYDLLFLPFNSQKRWENTAQWCKYKLVKEGLISANSSRGIWEITEKGKEYLLKNF